MSSDRKRIHLIAGARPNFMKVAPLWWELSRRDLFDSVIVHTGQHYDKNMSDSFFNSLNLPPPHFRLEVGSGTHAVQTAKIMLAYEPICLENRPDIVVVCGDVNSTVACALVASKLQIPVVHLEAGLRSRDRTMPEELNRIVTDQLSDVLWTPSPDGTANLQAEGIPSAKIDEIGNIMIDSLVYILERAPVKETLRSFNVEPGKFVIATIHRPSNVDNAETVRSIAAQFASLSESIPFIWPIHPRTEKIVHSEGIKLPPSVRVVSPLPYEEFISLVASARMVVTDSGGIQEETSYLGIPCLTLRPNTERPITIELGTNQLVELHQLPSAFRKLLTGGKIQKRPIPLWDGCTASRAVDSLVRRFLSSRSQ